jgi:hypothetical protein
MGLMINLNIFFFTQVLIFISSVISLTLLYSIINVNQFELNFFIKAIIFIALYYFIWSIILLFLICCSRLIKENYYDRCLNIFIFLNLIYDISLMILNILGLIYMTPYLSNNLEKKYTPIIIYYMVYQIFSFSHILINIRIYIFCCNSYHRISRITPDIDNMRHERNNIILNNNRGNNIIINNRINYINNNDLDININLNYLRVKNIPEVLNQNIEYCCICMENLIKVKILPCNHREFCLRCIEKLNEFKCPLCRNSFNYIENEISMTPILNNIVISEA